MAETEIHVERLTSFEDVCAVARHGDSLRLRGQGKLHLDFASRGPDSEAAARRSRSLSPPYLMVLANLMLGAWEAAPVQVTLPRWAPLRRQCARGGLLFAMANHSHLDPRSWGAVAGEIQEAWARTWTPANEDFRQRLFAAPMSGSASPDATIQEKLATFLNPHRAPRVRITEEINPNLTQPWLYRLIGDVPLEERAARDELGSEVGRVVEELLLNIRLHASLLRSGFSYIQIFVTSGGGDESANRLYVCVFDLGEGIAHTVGKRQGTPEASTERVWAALEGELPHYDRDQGYGLNKIKCIVEKNDGKLLVATAAASDAGAGSAVVAELEAERYVRRPEVLEGLPLRGTMVTVTLPLKWIPGARATKTHDLQLSFEEFLRLQEPTTKR